jgi:hypothetical protein
MERGSLACQLTDVAAMIKPDSPDINLQSLPPSCLGPNAKLLRMSDEEHRQYIGSVLRRLDEVEQIPDGDDDPVDALEQMMRGIDEMRPHRPLFKGNY